MRKPREFSGYGPMAYCDRPLAGERGYRLVTVGSCRMSSKQLRSFATWLLKAADWLEEKEK